MMLSCIDIYPSFLSRGRSCERHSLSHCRHTCWSSTEV
uniref:Uncharacterized protein n=1 Tax=Rhizophora mucronata TaxID=61149 RepID=A0A2P2QPE9_RHIMU